MALAKHLLAPFGPRHEKKYTFFAAFWSKTPVPKYVRDTCPEKKGYLFFWHLLVQDTCPEICSRHPSRATLVLETPGNVFETPVPCATTVRNYQHWTPVLCAHWLTAQGQWAIPYDSLRTDCLYVRWPRSEKCEAGRVKAEGSHHRHHGVRSRTTDTTASYWTSL
jgi:hypothetical protein